MEYLIAFLTPSQNIGMQYDRHDGAKSSVYAPGNRYFMAQLCTGFSGGGMTPATGVMSKPVQLKLISIESGKPVDVLLGPDSTALVGKALPVWIYAPGKQVDGWSVRNGAIVCNWTIKAGTVPDGMYYMTSTADSTLELPVIINESKIPVKATKLLAQPPYMSTGNIRGWPFNRNTAIIDYLGIRKGDTALYYEAFRDGGLFDKPFVHTTGKSEMYSEAMCVCIRDYDGLQWPTETPMGGPFLSATQRYAFTDTFRPNPTLDAANKALTDTSPSDMHSGDSQTATAGVVVSIFQLVSKDFIVMQSAGRISLIEYKTRKWTTLYGWERIPGTAQPRAGAQLPAGPARLDWYKKYFRFIGTGPDIVRAWQMRPSIDDEMFVWVADPTNHTILGIDLRTGIAKVVAGISGVAGYADGALGIAKFDQPRGVIQIKSGQYAGMLVVSDEHNSAYRLVNPQTGEVSTLTRAQRVPKKFGPGGDFTSDIAVNRANWGATSSAQTFDNAQFVHPCQLDLMSDGKTVISVHHDEYQVFKINLDEKTILTLYSAPTVINNAIALPFNWPTVNVDQTGALGIKDGIYVCHWHANSQVILHPDGTKHPFYTSSQSTMGDGMGIDNDAYPRLLAPMPDGSLIVHGDAHSRLGRARKIRPDDPRVPLNDPRYLRGEMLYRADGANGRCAVMAINGAQGRNMLAGYLTPGELAMLSPTARKVYMRAKFGVDEWTDQDHLNVAYYLDNNDSIGVAWIRAAMANPIEPIKPTPMDFKTAQASVTSGKSISRAGGSPTLTLADLQAADWVVKSA